MIEIKELTQTCQACPSQWEFYTFDNRPVYVRYRWGFLSVSIGKQNGILTDAVINGVTIIGKEIGNNMDGFIEWGYVEKELNKLTKKEILIIIYKETADNV
jgi:hypothetical protein